MRLHNLTTKNQFGHKKFWSRREIERLSHFHFSLMMPLDLFMHLLHSLSLRLPHFPSSLTSLSRLQVKGGIMLAGHLLFQTNGESGKVGEEGLRLPFVFPDPLSLES